MTNLEYKKDYASAFVRSAGDIFQKELNVSLKKRFANIKQSSSPGFPLSIIIGFVSSSSFKGQVVYSMSQDVGFAFARQMLPDPIPAKRKEMLHSILGEVANMIPGRASIVLAGNQDKIDITPPLVIEGNTKFDFLKVPTIVLVFDSTVGSLEVNIAFQEK